MQVKMDRKYKTKSGTKSVEYFACAEDERGIVYSYTSEGKVKPRG